MKSNFESRIVLTLLLGLLVWWWASLTTAVLFAAGNMCAYFVMDYIALCKMRRHLTVESLEEDTIYGPNEEFNVLWGTAEQYKKHYEYIDMKGPVKIMRAATMTPEGVIYSVSTPGRHHHSHQAMDELSGLFGGEHHKEEGFIDSKGNFLDRENAVFIARTAGQLFRNGLPKTNPQSELFSEDLW